ncbi:hypothetical protein D0862_12127 [Hortaea werneckii]|uniref:HhH-GPD domain-containing protein n=1 Tax=Hortaea werneckii TaxID=91943 RepID=A0A3M7F0K5_HORWE|nr:hypothetical protein KC320_g7712 [Hortaea werneckii]RMY82086.1 hypothetical protein D0862_12127 [Hortaea werneckii]
MAKKRQRHSQGNSANQASAQPSPKKQKLGDGHAHQPGPSTPSANTNVKGPNRTGPSDDRKDQEQNSVVKPSSAEAPSHLSRKQRKRWRKRLEEAGEAAAAQYAAQAFAEGNSEQALSPSIHPSAPKTVADDSAARKPVSRDLMRKVTATTLATPPRKRWVEMNAPLLRQSKLEDRKGTGGTGNSAGAREGTSYQMGPAGQVGPLKEGVSKASEVASTPKPLVKSVPNSQARHNASTVGKLSESVTGSHNRPSVSRNTAREDTSGHSDKETNDASDDSSNNEGKGALPGLATLSTVPPQDDDESTNSDPATSSEVKANAPVTPAPEMSTLDILRAASQQNDLSSVRNSPVAPSLSSFGASLRNSYGGPGGSLAFTAPVGTKPTSVPTTNVREDVRTVFDRFSAFVSGHDGDDSDDDEDEDDESSSDESDVVMNMRPVTDQQTGGPLAEKSHTSFPDDAKSFVPSGDSQETGNRGKHEVPAADSSGSVTTEKGQQNHHQDAATRQSTEDESEAASESADSDSSKSTTNGTKPIPQLDGAGSGTSGTHQHNAANDPRESSVETESDVEGTNNAAAAPSSSSERGNHITQREEEPVPVDTAIEENGSVKSASEDTSESADVLDQSSKSAASASKEGKDDDIVPNVTAENGEQSLLEDDSEGEAESDVEEGESSLDIRPASPVRSSLDASVKTDGRSKTITRSQNLQHPGEARTSPPVHKAESTMQTNDEPINDLSHNSVEAHADGTTNMAAARDQSAEHKGVDEAATSDDSSESGGDNDENWPSLLLHRSSVSHSSPQTTRSRHFRDHEPESGEDSSNEEDDTPASQIQRELGQEQTDLASSGTVLVPDSANTSQQTKGANGHVVDNRSNGDDDETDDADAKVQSSQADKGRAESAQTPAAFTPINAAADTQSQANNGSRLTGAKPNNKKHISFLDQRPGSAGSAPAHPTPFPDRMEDDDINQTIDEISRDVLKNSTRPLPPSKNLNLSARTNADDPDAGDLTIDPSLHELELAAHHRVAKEVSIPLPDPALFKNVIVYCSREVPVFQPQLEVGLSSLERVGIDVDDDGDTACVDTMQNMVGKMDEQHQDTSMSGVGLPLLQRNSSSSSLSELGPSPSPPGRPNKESPEMDNQSEGVVDEPKKPQEDLSLVGTSGDKSEDLVTAQEEDTKRDVVPPTELRKKRKMTGMTSKHFSPPKRTTRARAKTEIPKQIPLEETEQAIVPDDGIGPEAEPTSDAAEPPTPAAKKTRPKRKATGKKSNHFLPFDLLDRVDLPLPPPPSSSSSPSRPRPVPGISRAPIPPISSPTFGIIQEKLHQEPFWLLIATTFLNQTSGRAAVPVFWALKNRFPTPDALAQAEYEVVLEMIRHLGLQRQRAKRVIAMARVWRDDPPRVGRRFRTKDYPRKGDHVGFNVRGRGSKGKGKGKGTKGKKKKEGMEEGENPKKEEEEDQEEQEEEKEGDGEGDGGRRDGVEKQDPDVSGSAVAGLQGDTPECRGSLEIGHIPGCGRYAYDSWRIFCRDVLRGVAEDYNGKGAIPPPTPTPSSASTLPTSAGEAEAPTSTPTSHHPPPPPSHNAPTNQPTEAPIPFEPEWKRVLPQDKELIATLRWMWLREGWIWDPSNGAKRFATPEEMERARKGEMEVQDVKERKFAERAVGVGAEGIDDGDGGGGGE